MEFAPPPHDIGYLLQPLHGVELPRKLISKCCMLLWRLTYQMSSRVENEQIKLSVLKEVDV
jgi:hypothetical protein